MRTLRTLVAVCTVLGLAFTAAAEPSDPDTADVFLFGADGQLHSAFNVGGETWTFGAFGNPNVSIFDENSVLLGTIGPFDPTTQFLLVNEAVNGLSSPSPDGNLPPFSLVALGPPPNNVGLVPSVSLQAVAGQSPLPDGGIANQTIAVSIEGTPGAQLQGDTSGMVLHWIIDGGPEQTANGANAEFAIAANGVHTVEVWATQNGGETTPHAQASWTISGNALTADLDDDGIPDIAEELLGFSPFDSLENGQNPWEHDGDGDGYSDFLEIICGPLGGDPDRPIISPLDSDGDGAIDCQEDWRGTNPNDTQVLLPDAPANRTPFEVEKVLSGAVEDAAEGGNAVAVEELTINFEKIEWKYSVPPSVLGDLGLAENELPSRLRPSVIQASLAAGLVPEVRVPANNPWVLTGTEAGEPRWVVRAWVPSTPALTPPVVTPQLAGTWTTGQEWIDDYVQFLRDNLVEPAPTDLNPATGAPIALAEYAAEVAAGAPPGVRFIWGRVAQFPTGPASKLDVDGIVGPNTLVTLGPRYSLANALCGADDLETDSMNALIARGKHLLSGGGPGNVGGVLAGFLADIEALHDDLDSLTTADTVAETAERTREPGLAGVTIYLDQNLNDIDALDPSDFALLLDPEGDFDADGRLNADEVLQPCDARTSMVDEDYDGDGIVDGADFLAWRAELNTPLQIAYQVMDSDGDGVIDALDNCMNTPNPDQADSNDDLNGDACPRFVRISRPRSNRRILAGQTVTFESEPSSASRITSVIWDFDGAAPPSTENDPGDVGFVTPGVYRVVLTSTSGTNVSTDERQIVVMGVGPMPMLVTDGPYFGVEGQPIAMTADAVSPNGAVTSIDWDFGDGNADSGAAVAHTYAQQGDYVIEVRATDAVEQFAVEQTFASVTDSVPVVAIGWTTTGPRSIQFTDDSTAYDGIAERIWSFGDGSPVSTEANPLHTYERGGSFEVTLTVVDADGSIAMTTTSVVTEAIPVPVFPHVAQRAALVALLLAGLALGRRQLRGHPAGD